MRDTNEMEVIFDSRSENEGFARVAVAAFLTQLNPTVEEVSDVKTAVSEAVTNSIIHGYEGDIRKISIRCRIRENTLIVRIRTRDAAWKMWNRRCFRCSQRSRIWIDPEWGLRLWRRLWTASRWSRSRESGPR